MKKCTLNCFECPYLDCMLGEPEEPKEKPAVDPKVEKQRAYSREYYRRHREERMAYTRAYMAEHREEVNARRRSKYAERAMNA